MIVCFAGYRGFRGTLWIKAILQLSRCKPLSTSTGLSRTTLLIVALCAGSVLASGSYSFADSNSDPIKILLYHLNAQDRLGFLGGGNEVAAKMYMFDTGSDQFNRQFYPKDTLLNNGQKTVYACGDRTYA